MPYISAAASEQPLCAGVWALGEPQLLGTSSSAVRLAATPSAVQPVQRSLLQHSCARPHLLQRLVALQECCVALPELPQHLVVCSCCLGIVASQEVPAGFKVFAGSQYEEAGSSRRAAHCSLGAQTHRQT